MSKNVFLKNINLSVIYNEPDTENITVERCVNDNGLFAIGTDGLHGKNVCVYDENGNFKYGYEFDCFGSFGIEWDDNDIIIYFVRDDVAASFDKTGANTELRRIKDTSDNNTYWYHFVFSDNRKIDGNTYTMKNNMGLLNLFATSYSQLIKTDPSGNEKILYDVSNTYTTKFIVIFITSILLFTMIVVVVITQCIKMQKARNI